MKTNHCPRCDKPVPPKYPVHLSCWFARAKVWVVAPVILTFLMSFMLLDININMAPLLAEGGSTPTSAVIAAVATHTPRQPLPATATSKPTMPPTATTTPTKTPTVTPTPTPVTPSVTVTNSTLNIRNGPGTEYLTIDSTRRGARFVIVGINENFEETPWVQVILEDGKLGWITGDEGYVTIANPEVLEDMPVIEVD